MTRKEIINALSQGQNIPELKPLYETLQLFFEDMGIPADTMQDVHRIFKRAVVNNTHFPDEDVFEFFPVFMKREYARGRYYNIEQMIEAINGHRSVIRLQQDFSDKKLNPFMENWPDQEIQRQCAIVGLLGIKPSKPDGYFARLKAELDKRGLSVPDIDLGKPGPLAKYL